ncbi:alpha-N-acetylgalactosamine-specific lectin-like isoform X2 [Pecten maximus]|uniref:alpha-N-acetylgalactosamine-specific lectin-like isoform X2 n=1 Tax=Pecten maximus TaxID=6579 RepID=UPI001458A902|nr:alpha-N-acetylgalactosamine-specific lectin-like isoform X2 [Pecten maximus]
MLGLLVLLHLFLRKVMLIIQITTEVLLLLVVWHDCREHGGWLMSDDNAEKHDYLSTLVYAFKGFHFNKFFIGGTDTAFENQWRWLETGVNVGPFTRWGTGEPDGNSSKNCLALKWENDRDLVWSDESCGHAATHHHHGHGLLNYICEKAVNNSGSMVIGRR